MLMVASCLRGCPTSSVVCMLCQILFDQWAHVNVCKACPYYQLLQVEVVLPEPLDTEPEFPLFIMGMLVNLLHQFLGGRKTLHVQLFW